MHHERSEIDLRLVRVRLTEKGRGARHVVSRLFKTDAEGLMTLNVLDRSAESVLRHRCDGSIGIGRNKFAISTNNLLSHLIYVKLYRI
jgi:DNA-binding MarR family transcriptional regulator